MDEGLGFALVPIFIIGVPITISSFILYFIFRNKKMSINGSIIGFIGASVIGLAIPVWDGKSIYPASYEYGFNAKVVSRPFIMVIFSGLLTAFTRLIVIKIFWR